MKTIIINKRRRIFCEPLDKVKFNIFKEMLKLSNNDIKEKYGLSRQYISMVLNCHKYASPQFVYMLLDLHITYLKNEKYIWEDILDKIKNNNDN